MPRISTFSFLLVVISAVALRPERSVGGGSLSVTLTLKSFAWFAVLEVVWVVAVAGRRHWSSQSCIMPDWPCWVMAMS